MNVARLWTALPARWLPFADAASAELPLARLLRLALFQVSVGMTTVLLVGTLNRVMIVELGVAASLVALMVALPVLVAPFRALIGFKSDTHRSFLGWRRVPYLWFGALLQFGGLAIMPFALILLSGDNQGPWWLGHAGAALAFLLAGAGLQTTQTAGLALVADLASPAARPRAVALMYGMLLVGMVASAFVFGLLLADFSALRLVQVVQGAAMVAMALNVVALWKQESPDKALTAPARPRPDFRTIWRRFTADGRAGRFLLAVGLGAAAFAMQDVILEPYGGEVLGLDVGTTTGLSALSAGGALAALALAARWLQRGLDAHRVAALGALAGIVAFSAVIFAEPLQSAALFCAGTALIGFGGGLFVVGSLTAAMALETQGLDDAAGGRPRFAGLALGAWGAVQATCAGLAIAAGGALRDGVSAAASAGLLGPALASPATGYSVVYHLEMLLLFATLVAIGPLVRAGRRQPPSAAGRFGLAEFPG